MRRTATDDPGGKPPRPATRLNARTLARGVAALSARDPDLAAIVARWGAPPLWARPPGFTTLVTIIVGQQVSLAAARAILGRLHAGRQLTPESLLGLSEDALRSFGFSRSKAIYCLGLARSIVANEIDLDALDALGDAEARTLLMRLKGVGPWTADIYLLSALRRPDVWPAGDLALATAVQEVKRLPGRPSPQELQQIAEPWRPWRAVAARMLWHHYLSSRGSHRVPGGPAPV